MLERVHGRESCVQGSSCGIAWQKQRARGGRGCGTVVVADVAALAEVSARLPVHVLEHLRDLGADAAAVRRDRDRTSLQPPRNDSRLLV